MRQQFYAAVGMLIFLCSHLPHTCSLSIAPSKTTVKDNYNGQLKPLPNLSGDWVRAKENLRKPDCCVVSVPGLEHHMHVLQKHFVDQGPADLDLRARVRVNHSSSSAVREDCLSIRKSVLSMDEDNIENGNESIILNDPCTDALIELARGVTSLADGPLENKCNDVFIRIVCASDYRAVDPMYHTDKAPLRGYVTLTGVGTEYMTRRCSPIEYAMLRAGGVVSSASSSGKGSPMGNSLRQAEKLEFIVMKGDYYAYEGPETSIVNSWARKVWTRMNACVHRSPPGATAGSTRGRRRVIVSLDLADGDDDREWYQAGSKREWRSGMTQRKSRLVA